MLRLNDLFTYYLTRLTEINKKNWKAARKPTSTCCHTSFPKHIVSMTSKKTNEIVVDKFSASGNKYLPLYS